MLFFLGLIFFQAVLVIGQDFPTICLDQGACYKGAWINTIHGGESGAFASFQGTVPKKLKKWDKKNCLLILVLERTQFVGSKFGIFGGFGWVRS